MESNLRGVSGGMVASGELSQRRARRKDAKKKIWGKENWGKEDEFRKGRERVQALSSRYLSHHSFLPSRSIYVSPIFLPYIFLSSLFSRLLLCALREKSDVLIMSSA